MDEIQTRFQDPFLKQIFASLPPELPIYLVGGIIRDMLLNRPSYDLDLVTSADAMKIARDLADKLGGAYFPLDTKRNVARIILKDIVRDRNSASQINRIDISKFQGADLAHDLKGRDFTFNAMAMHLHDQDRLIDPSGGASDLLSKRLRACSENTFLNDPVRILRAVRFSVNLGFTIQPDTLRLMEQAIPHLPEISAERLRDELFRMLVLPHTATAMRILDKIGVLEFILPEVCALKDVQQSAPHVLDAWNHTLDSIYRLESLLEVLALDFNPDKASNLALGMVALQLGRYRDPLSAHLNNPLNPERPHRGLLFLAGLYHDVGKLTTQNVDEEGKIRFLGHEKIGSKLAEKRAVELKLSNLEIARLVSIVSHHMRPSFLSHPLEPPSKKAIYRFFRDTGAAGVDICILSLADVLATYGPTLPPERWNRHLQVVRSLYHAWWENREEQILPAAMVNGEELITTFGLESGPIIGYILESVREGQITGEITTKGEAMKWVRALLDQNLNKKTG
jgi:putative nucleotidyltransferase with HDIG domain